MDRTQHPGRQVGEGLACRQGGMAPDYRRAHRLERLEDPRACVVDTHARDRHLGSFRYRPRHEQEGRGGDVTRDGDALPDELRPGFHRDGRTVDRQLRPEARQHALGVVARALRLLHRHGPIRPEARQEQRRLDLGRGDGRVVGHRLERPRPSHSQRQAVAAVAADDRGAHARQRLALRESSPVRKVQKGCPASTPMSRRTPVPELPQSMTCSGSRSPESPAPSTR